MMPDDVTELDKLNVVLRELTMRRIVYRRRVAEGKMTEREAEWQIRVMEAIVIDYQKITRGERLI